jgi:hypothetical protein
VPSLVALALQADTAPAAHSWCRRDPVFKIDDLGVDRYVSSDKTMTDAATGPVALVVSVPAGVALQLLASDNGFGYAIATQPSTALKAAAPSLPVKIDVTPRSKGRVKSGIVQGFATRRVVLQTG